MKINGKIISSIQDLRQNFNFIELWQKLPVFQRDLNPTNVSYTEEDKSIYDFFINADKVTINNDSMQLGNNIKHLSNDQKPILEINELSQSDRVKIIALFTLVKKEIPLNLIKVLFKPISEYGDSLCLSYGKSISLCDNPQINGDLTTKKIFVLPSSINESQIGNVILKPGEVTYGIFAKDSLVNVCPNEQVNQSFHLKFHLLPDYRTKLVVTNISTGSIIAEYPDCTYFSPLRDNNFILINKGLVECFHDSYLMNTIRKKIELIDEPQYFEINDTAIIFTLKKGNKVKINY